jgi:DNA-binding CsgD family transcriptional regulator
MQTTNLPAGLVDQNVEVFVHGGKLKATYNGKVQNFMSLPPEIIDEFYNLLIEDEEAREEFARHEIKDTGFMLKEYIRCNFGGWDRTPDFADGKFHREYWNCPQRGDCFYKEKICPKLQLKNGQLSRREIDVIQLIAKGYYAKEIAEHLGLSKNTITTHTRNIHQKLLVNNNQEVTSFAFKNNLVK